MSKPGLDEFFSETTEPEDPLRAELIAIIRTRHDATPRHLQVELGPSEIAHPCMRKMAYGMMQVERCNPDYDPLPSIIGVATHKWLESAAELANNKLGWQRWLIETRLDVTTGLFGSCDLYDHVTATVVDWKVPGTNRFRKYKKDPGPVYKMQVHLYAKGFTDAGLPVKQVAIALLPRGGLLRGMHVWKADYDPRIAEQGLQRRDAVIALLNDLRIEVDPDRYQWIPATPYDCVWCPWFAPQPKNGLQCKGDQ